MSTSLQRKASKVNGAKSQGPKSPETKAISSKNALKHGMTARKHSLPDEDPVERQQRATQIAQELNPQSELQNHLVGCINSAIDLQLRCQRALHGKLASQFRAARDPQPPKLRRLLEKAQELFRSGRPLQAVLLLRRSATGCRWLRQLWIDVRNRLKRYGVMSEADLEALLRLMGETLGRRSTTPVINDLVYLAGKTWTTQPPLSMQAYERGPAELLQKYRSQWPTPQAHAEELLRRIDGYIAELDALIEELDAREEAEREDRAAQAMMIEDPAEADRWLRYTKDAATLLSRSLKEFFEMKDREAAEADEEEDAESVAADESPPPGAESDPPPQAHRAMGVPGTETAAPAVLPTAAAGAASHVQRNEPGAPAMETLVSGGTETYVADLGIDSDLSAGLADPAHAAWPAAMADPRRDRPPGG
jgi:hypothetical protein